MKVIDHGVTAKYIDNPTRDETKVYKNTNLFKSKHMLKTQHFSVILKSDDKSCCQPFKTKWDLLFPNRRSPNLISFKYFQSGPDTLQLEKDVSKKIVDFHHVFARIVLKSTLAPQFLLKKIRKVNSIWHLLSCSPGKG